MLVPFFFLFALLSLHFLPPRPDPEDGFVRRIGVVYTRLAQVKLGFDLAEVITSRYKHSDSRGVVYVQDDPVMDQVGLPLETLFFNDTRISLETRLWDGPFNKVTSPLMTLEPRSVSVEIPLWEESPVEVDPLPSSLEITCDLLFAVLVFASVLCEILGSRDAHKLRTLLPTPIEKFFAFLCRPQVQYLVADGDPSLYETMDALVAGPDDEIFFFGASVGVRTGSEALDTSWELLQPPDVWIHRKVVKAIRRLELRRLIDEFEELSRIAKGLESRPRDAVTIPVAARDLLDAAGSPEPYPRRALVLRRPDNLVFLVFQLACALRATWERHSQSRVPVSSQQVVVKDEPTADESPSDKLTGPRRKPRASQKKRRRLARMRAAAAEPPSTLAL